jgi:formate--tetrahydrofolate ligase
VSISWPRVVDVNDCALRRMLIGVGGPQNGYPCETRFDSAAESEVMAIIRLAQSLSELRGLGVTPVGFVYL